MATTSQTNVKKDKGVSKKGSAPTLKKNNAKEDGGLDAKEFCGKKCATDTYPNAGTGAKSQRFYLEKCAIYNWILYRITNWLFNSYVS